MSYYFARSQVPPQGIQRTNSKVNRGNGPNSSQIPGPTSQPTLPLASASPMSLSKEETSLSSDSSSAYTTTASTTILGSAVDDILNSGIQSFSESIGNFQFACDTWTRAIEVATEENDMIKAAKAYGNIGFACRTVGRWEESRRNYDKAWAITIQLFKSKNKEIAVSKSALMAAKCLGIENLSDAENSVNNSNPALYHEASTNDNHSLIFLLLVWVLDLMSNVGNIEYIFESYEKSIKLHSNCKTLSQSIMEEYPAPLAIEQVLRDINSTEYSKSKPAYRQPILKSNTSASISSTGSQNNVPQRKYRLSYLHRSMVMAYVKALNNIGNVFTALESHLNALQYHCTSFSLLEELCKMVPIFSASNLAYPASATLEISIGNTVLHLRAQISGNVANSWAKVGNLSKSMLWMKKSMELFRLHGDVSCPRNMRKKRPATIGEVRTESILGNWTLNLIFCSQTAIWLKQMANFPEEASNFWKLPMRHENEKEMATKSVSIFDGVIRLVDKALSTFYVQAYRQKHSKDYKGLQITWLNIATAYCFGQRPILALRYISLVVSGQNERKMAPYLRFKTLNLIANALFCLLHINPSCGQTPPRMFSGPDDFADFILQESLKEVNFEKKYIEIEPIPIQIRTKIQLFLMQVLPDAPSLQDSYEVITTIRQIHGSMSATMAANQSFLSSINSLACVNIHIEGEYLPFCETTGDIDTMKSQICSLNILTAKLGCKIGCSPQEISAMICDMLGVREVAQMTDAMLFNAEKYYKSVQTEFGKGIPAGFLTYRHFSAISDLLAYIGSDRNRAEQLKTTPAGGKNHASPSLKMKSRTITHRETKIEYGGTQPTPPPGPRPLQVSPYSLESEEIVSASSIEKVYYSILSQLNEVAYSLILDKIGVCSDCFNSILEQDTKIVLPCDHSSVPHINAQP